MKNYTFAAIGIEPSSLTVLRPVLNMVADATASWNLIENPEQARVTFVGGLTAKQLTSVIEKLGRLTLLVYCCGRGETPPEGIFSIRLAWRSTDISQLFDLVKKHYAPVPALTTNVNKEKETISPEKTGYLGYHFNE